MRPGPRCRRSQAHGSPGRRSRHGGGRSRRGRRRPDRAGRSSPSSRCSPLAATWRYPRRSAESPADGPHRTRPERARRATRSRRRRRRDVRTRESRAESRTAPRSPHATTAAFGLTLRSAARHSAASLVGERGGDGEDRRLSRRCRSHRPTTSTRTCLALSSTAPATDSRAAPTGIGTASSAVAVPAVRLEGITKVFGNDAAGRRVAASIQAATGVASLVAVDHIDLDVRDGEFFSMLGPSGSGKTTTLRMIAGFEVPTAGRILLHGRDVTGIPPFDRDVNTVFQDYALFPHLSVGDNVGYGLMVRKVARQERDARVTDALRMVRLEGYENRKPNQLS